MTMDTIHLADFQAFACTGCGLCCIRPWNVIIEPEVEDGIRNSQFHGQRAREGYVPLEIEDSGRVVAHRQNNGNCMFLKEDLLCGLHSELGSTGKPVGCQIYPYRAVRTPSGTFFSMSFACPPVVAALDTDVEANRADLTAILARFPDIAGEVGWVNLTGEHGIPWEGYLELEPCLLQSYLPDFPMDSVLLMAASLAGDAVKERESWKDGMGLSPLDLPLLRDLLMDYLCAVISIVENETDHAARADYGRALSSGQRLPSVYFDGTLPELDLNRTLPPWALEHCHRYFHNVVIGKAILGPSIVSRLLAMAVGYAMLALYAEGLHQASGEPELSLQSWTKAFEIVEADAVSHSTSMVPFFEDFEGTLRKLILVE